MEIGTEK